MAELFGGHGRELNDFLYVFIGSATGGGVVIGGDYQRGAHGNAGDIGLMPTAPSPLPTAPSPNRRFEILLTRASINSLARHLRGSGPPSRRAELDAAIAAHGDGVDEWLDDCVDALLARCYRLPACWMSRPWCSMAIAPAGPQELIERLCSAWPPPPPGGARRAADGAGADRPPGGGDRCRDPAAAPEL